MRFLKAFCLFLCSTAGLTSGHQERCHAKSTISNYDASKHSYKFIANPDTTEVKLPGCKPVHVWSFTRLGNLWPEKELKMLGDMFGTDIELFVKDLPWLRDLIVTNHEQGKGLLCEEDIENFKKWELNLDFNFSSEEMFELGRRFKARFPDLLNRPYRVKDFSFGASPVKDDSYKHFAEAIWGTLANYINYENSDPAARFLRLCKRPTEEEKSLSDLGKILRNQVLYFGWEDTVRNVSQRLGFSRQLPTTSVLTMYTMCLYDKAQHFFQTDFNLSRPPLHEYISPWCAAFSENNVGKLFVFDVLRLYSRRSFNPAIEACGLISDLLNKMSSIVSGSAKIPYATFYFSQSRAMANGFVAFYHSLWGLPASKGAIGLNHAFVLFECASGSHQVQFYVNERLVELPWCHNTTCEYSQFVSTMMTIFPFTAFREFCGKEIFNVNNWKSGFID